MADQQKVTYDLDTLTAELAARKAMASLSDAVSTTDPKTQARSGAILKAMRSVRTSGDAQTALTRMMHEALAQIAPDDLENAIFEVEAFDENSFTLFARIFAILPLGTSSFLGGMLPTIKTTGRVQVLTRDDFRAEDFSELVATANVATIKKQGGVCKLTARLRGQMQVVFPALVHDVSPMTLTLTNGVPLPVTINGDGRYNYAFLIFRLSTEATFSSNQSLTVQLDNNAQYIFSFSKTTNIAYAVIMQSRLMLQLSDVIDTGTSTFSLDNTSTVPFREIELLTNTVNQVSRTVRVTKNGDPLSVMMYSVPAENPHAFDIINDLIYGRVTAETMSKLGDITQDYSAPFISGRGDLGTTRAAAFA